LRRVAARAHDKRHRHFTETDLHETIQDLLPIAVLQDLDRFRDELLRDDLIVRNGSVYEFFHLSAQEFLAAKDLIGDPRGRGVKCVFREFLSGDNWWKEVVSFYVGLCGNPREFVNWLLTFKDADPTTEAFRAVLDAVEAQFPDLRLRTQ
jgi:predicted NACHT family NTPase